MRDSRTVTTQESQERAVDIVCDDSGALLTVEGYKLVKQPGLGRDQGLGKRWPQGRRQRVVACWISFRLAVMFLKYRSLSLPLKVCNEIIYIFFSLPIVVYPLRKLSTSAFSHSSEYLNGLNLIARQEHP